MRNILLLTATLLMLTASLSAQKKKDKNYVATDCAAILPLPYDYQSNKAYDKITDTSFYLTMRDSVQLAVNLYLPKGLPADAQIPTILYQTRYWRGGSFRWPFNMFLSNFSTEYGKLIEQVILNGYAVMAVDVRGSGASTGQRDYPWTMDEIKDGAELVDWAIAQPWSNGKVGSAGVSYSGTTAEFLAVNRHPAVKCVVPMFSLFDVYDDISFPNGVHFEYFTKNWGAANVALDNNQFPEKAKKAGLVVRGVQPVKGEKKMLKEAVAAHQDNLNVYDGAKTIVYRDDRSGNAAAAKAEIFSPYFYKDEIDKSGTVVYSISGWYDGDYQHACIKRFLTYNNPLNKLTLGPWEHGGGYNCSPANAGYSGFDKLNELMKFFDQYLKDKPTTIEQEPRVHYFTMVEEKWKAADTWPPAGTKDVPVYFAKGNQLSTTLPTENSGTYTYQVDTTVGTGSHTRWKSVFGQLKQPQAYPNFKERLPKMLVVKGDALPTDMEITGHAIAKLHLSSSDEDGAVFVYLLDEAPNGDINYITEGNLRLIHRKLADPSTRPYPDVVPYHSYLKEDAMPMVPGKAEEVVFDLLPVSYLVQKGHKIVIALSAVDKDHFTILDSPEDKLTIHYGGDKPSSLVLPVMQKL